MDVAETGISAERSPASVWRRPVTPAGAVLIGTLAISGLTLLLARSFVWAGPDRPRAFEFLFLRDEPAAALLGAALIVLAAIVAFAKGLPDRLFVSSLAKDPRLFIACVTAVLAASALLVYRGHALSMDEYAPLFQARIFARGKLIAQVPPEVVQRLIPPFRWFIEASPDGRMVSAYWPGFALLLTPFVWLGAHWLLNPLIGGATLLVLWRIARRLWPDTAAPGWVVLLTAASPAFVVNAISLYSMAAHLLVSACFFALLLEPTPRRLFWAGVVGSVGLTLHNPVPHTLVALPFIVALAVRPGRARRLGALACGYLPGVVLLGAGWFWVRAQVGGNAETAAHSAGDAIGAMTRVAFALPSLDSLWSRAVNLSELSLWAVPGLLVLACMGAVWRRRETSVRLIAAGALLTFAAFLFVPYSQGHGWGYRYFHAAWAVLPLLGAAALEHPSAGPGLRRMALVAAAGSLLLGNALRFAQVRTFVDGQLRQVPKAASTSRLEVVFLRPDRGYYTIDLVQNDPFLDGERWILISRGPEEDARFMARFPKARRTVRTSVAELWQID